MSSLAQLLGHLQPRPAVPEPAAPALDPALLRAEAYAEGEAAGRAAAEAALAPLRADLAAAAAALAAAVQIDPAPLRPVLAALVRRTCEAVLAREVRLHDDALVALAGAALACVRPGETPVLVAHPDTLARLAPHLPDLAMQPDPDTAPGSLSVMGPTFRIDADIADRLAEALEALP